MTTIDEHGDLAVPADDEIHARIRRDLPDGTFDRRPGRVLWFAPPAALVAASMVMVIRGHVSRSSGWPWPW